MMNGSPEFFVTGGTLSCDALSYVVRAADKELHEALSRREFCYVLTSRQMGKSSLMVRAASKLRAEGVAVAVIDLTALGQSLNPLQWYRGMLSLIGQQLNLEEVLARHWREHSDLSPVQRFMSSLRQVVLQESPHEFVLFVDEIDVVRSLGFEYHEFFAAIRESYNRRSTDPVFARLTFCLLGVATPSDLIQDVRTTPFNVGRRIRLDDFTEAETASLSLGLEFPGIEGRPRASRETRILLRRILRWTGGHPYLTQRLCRAVAANSGARRPRDVDRVCEELFLSPTAQEQDDNLLFVRDRLLKWQVSPFSAEESLNALLTLYRRILESERVRVDETDAVTAALRLSGAVVVRKRRLVVRNRIYNTVFDRSWIETHTPGAELRRQRLAYRRGLLRAGAISAFVLTALSITTGAALYQTQQALERSRALSESHYALRVNAAAREAEQGHFEAAIRHLEDSAPKEGQEDLREFTWWHLWKRTHPELAKLNMDRLPVAEVRLAPDGRSVMAATDGGLRIWRLPSGEASRSFSTDLRIWGHLVTTMSPDGRYLVNSGTESDRLGKQGPARLEIHDTLKGEKIFSFEERSTRFEDLRFCDSRRLLVRTTNALRLLNVETGRWQAIPVPREPITAVSITSAGGLVAALENGDLRIWQRLGEVPDLRFHLEPGIVRLAVSPGNRLVAYVKRPPPGKDGVASLVVRRNIAGQLKPIASFPRSVNAITFSADENTMFAGGDDGDLLRWKVGNRDLRVYHGHEGAIYSVSGVGPDLVATGSSDGTVRVWNPNAQEARSEQSIPRVNASSLSADGKTLVGVTREPSAAAVYWKAGRGETARKTLSQRPYAVAVSADGKTAVVVIQDGILLWKPDSLMSEPLAGASAGINGCAVSPAGDRIAAASSDGSLLLWELPDLRSQVLAPHRAYTCVAFSSDGSRLAFGSAGEAASVMDLRTRKVLVRIPCFDLRTLKFSPDGRAIAVGQAGGTLVVDIATGRKKSLETSGASSLIAFAADSRTLAVLDSTQTLKLWSLRSNLELMSIPLGATGVGSLTFTPDNRALLAATTEGRLLRWNAPTF